jgi:hypothetical protein
VLVLSFDSDLIWRFAKALHEPFDRLAFNESIHNLRDVGDRNASVKKMIGFD